jgi:hypothetical protein
MIITEVWVPGNPRTKGSLLNNQDTLQSKRWRALMADQVRRDIARRSATHPGYDPTMPPYTGAVDVELVAFLAVPAAATRAEFLGGAPTRNAPAIWHNAGDVDKLARNVLDAIAADAKSAIMNGGAIMNDNQVIRLMAEKYAAAPDEHGLWLRVETVGAEELVARARRANVIRRAAGAFR